MKIGVVCSRYDGTPLDTSLEYVGVDHGIDYLYEMGIKPTVAIGDFDSLKHQEILENLDTITLPTIKDETDLEAAIMYLEDNRFTDITVYGTTGGRLDHFMAVISILAKYPELKIKVIDKQNKIQLLNTGRTKIYKNNYKYFSLFALENTNISISGAAYQLDNYLLRVEDPLCVSNQIKDEYAIIENNKNIILIQSND
ncbi:MAG: thiamine diphosphokinase [Thomasclavelia sp.]|nr:thiamine diphosphokinase [Thomasclavelia sp.]